LEIKAAAVRVDKVPSSRAFLREGCISAWVGRRRRRTRAGMPDSSGHSSAGPISMRNRTDLGAEL